MKTFLNIAVIFLLTISVIGCSGDTPVPAPADDSEMVNFVINVYAGDPDAPGSRAGILPGDDYFEGPQTEYERMRTLRVIIVRPDGTVEHNEYLYRSIPSSGISQYNNIRLKVEGGEKKLVYVFANEASMFVYGKNNPAIDFNSFTIGSKLSPEVFDALKLNCEAGQPLYDNTGGNKMFLPMSEQFEIDIKAPKADGTDVDQSANLFITRAAVKFGFFVTPADKPFESYTIEEFEIQSLGNVEYLLPNNANYVPAKYPVYHADRYITTYDVPEGAENKPYVFKPNITITPSTPTDQPIAYTPALYFPETKLAADKKFYIRMRLTGDKEYSGEVPLPNLPSLPRNTYVKINVTVGLSDVKFTVDIMPYAAVPLNPTFGFDELLPRPPQEGGERPPWVEIGPDDNK